jgi:hypothetical protein
VPGQRDELTALPDTGGITTRAVSYELSGEPGPKVSMLDELKRVKPQLLQTP